MIWEFAVDVLVAVLVVTAWYVWFRRQNRQRSQQILRWIQCLPGGSYPTPRIRWQNASRFQVELQLCPSVFRRAWVSIQLEPREMPLGWAINRLRGRRETVIFQAELDCRPAFNLYVQQHRWCGRTRRIKPASLAGWSFQSLGPSVISTRDDWQKQIGPMLETLLEARSHQFLHLEFRKKTPHIVASAPLDSLRPGGQASGMFEVLRELASSASASTP